MDNIEQQREGWRKKAKEVAKNVVAPREAEIDEAVGTMPVVLGGTNELRARVLPKLAKEKGLICFCLTEPESGSDAASVRTKAVLVDDHYVVNWRKRFITHGGVADFYTVFANTHPGKGLA